jgi:hypothetical protein
VIVVEGYFDYLRVHRAGLPSVVALMGSSLSAEHENALLAAFGRLVLLLDGMPRHSNPAVQEMLSCRSSGAERRLAGSTIARSYSAVAESISSPVPPTSHAFTQTDDDLNSLSFLGVFPVLFLAMVDPSNVTGLFLPSAEVCKSGPVQLPRGERGVDLPRKQIRCT